MDVFDEYPPFTERKRHAAARTEALRFECYRAFPFSLAATLARITDHLAALECADDKQVAYVVTAHRVLRALQHDHPPCCGSVTHTIPHPLEGEAKLGTYIPN